MVKDATQEKLEREAKDRCMVWLAGHHPEALLRTAGVEHITSCQSLGTVLSHPKTIPDGAFKVWQKGRTKPSYYVLEVTTYPDKEECDQVLKTIAMVLLEFDLVPDVISMVLAPKGIQTQQGQRQLRSANGSTTLACSWQVVNLYNMHSNDLLALNLVGVVPLIPFTVLDGEPKVVLEECRKRIEEQATPEDRENLLAVAATFTWFRFDSKDMFRIFLERPQAMIAAPVLQELMIRAPEAAANLPFVKDLVQQASERAERLGRLEDAREALEDNVKARFGAVPDDVRAAIQALTNVERLRGLRPVTVLESLDKIRDELKK